MKRAALLVLLLALPIVPRAVEVPEGFLFACDGALCSIKQELLRDLIHSRALDCSPWRRQV